PGGLQRGPAPGTPLALHPLAVTDDAAVGPSTLRTDEQPAGAARAEAATRATMGADGEAGNAIGQHASRWSMRDATERPVGGENEFRSGGAALQKERSFSRDRGDGKQHR